MSGGNSSSFGSGQIVMFPSRQLKNYIFFPQIKLIEAEVRSYCRFSLVFFEL